jgi:geranylgeranylglycerol-phosphate geranylgeranyltransferase
MKILYFIPLFSLSLNVYSFTNIKYSLNIRKKNPFFKNISIIPSFYDKLQTLYPKYEVPSISTKNSIPPIPAMPPLCCIFSLPPRPPNQNKFLELLKLIRAKNIAPTLFLCISGGWIINPSLLNLLYSPTFIVYTINTILIMSASMIINDLYDIEIDKINNPDRPLVKGTIQKSEAIGLTLLLLGTSEYLSLKYLPVNLQTIIHLTIIYINLYTPIFKKILVIKNISCAAIISISLFFAGLASTNVPLNLNPNFNLLIIATNLIFTGAWTNEIILDIHDYEGDKKQNIQTLPTILGKETSLTCTGLILYLGSIMNIIALANLYNYKIACFLFLLIMPQLHQLDYIKKNNYSNNSIYLYMKQINQTLVIILLYLMTLTI